MTQLPPSDRITMFWGCFFSLHRVMLHATTCDARAPSFFVGHLLLFTQIASSPACEIRAALMYTKTHPHMRWTPVTGSWKPALSQTLLFFKKHIVGSFYVAFLASIISCVQTKLSTVTKFLFLLRFINFFYLLFFSALKCVASKKKKKIWVKTKKLLKTTWPHVKNKKKKAIPDDV